jgi:multidrug efflux pump subunit AcrA (membrane-fusion protein)
MRFYTSTYGKLAVAATTGVVVVVGGSHFLFANEPAEEKATVVTTREQKVFLSTSTVPVRVSGVVVATDSTVVYAETAGVVTTLPAREGATVGRGTVLAIQATPVADARLALAAAERGLGGLQQSLNSELRSGQSVQAAYRAYSASEIASLRAEGNDTRVQEGSTALLTALQQSVLSITSAVNYVHQNRPLFSAAGLRLYDEVVTGLYGTVPDYFRGGVTTAGASATDLETMLKEVTLTNDPAALETLSLLVDGQLTALTKLFVTGESDVFDRGSSFVTASMQSEYIAERAAVLSAAQSLHSTSATFAQVVDSVLEDGVSQQTNVNVTDIDRELALTQASYAEAIALQADAVAAAGEGVAAAEASLGRPRAPFAGTISRVFVEEGQYVMPGTPLLTLVGSGARELRVTIPTALLSGVAVGQAFQVEGVTVGYVDRFSPVSEGGSAEVVVALSGAAVSVGSSLSGTLLTTVSDVYAVPRSHVFFNADGPYLIYEDGEETKVVIIYDAGALLYVTGVAHRTLPLQAARSITL